VSVWGEPLAAAKEIGVRRWRQRIVAVRRSRGWYRAISLVLLALSAASLSLLLIDRVAFQSEMPSRLPDNRAAVSFGVRTPQLFKSHRGANRAYFNFCPFSDGEWRVRFNWQVRVGPEPDKFIKSAPTVVISIPDDAFDVTAEKVVAPDPVSDKVERLDQPLTLRRRAAQ